MTWYPAYLESKDEITDFINSQRPDFTTGSKIADVDVKMADTAIFSYLYNNGRIKVVYDGSSETNSPSVSDQLNLLWAASLAYNCEFLSYRGIIHYNVGGIESSKRGNITTKFMRMQPMFFMGNNPNNLDHVMPFRSFKQIAQHFLDTFIELHNYESGIKWGEPVYAWDPTSRGWGAVSDLDNYMKNYDDEITGSYNYGDWDSDVFV